MSGARPAKGATRITGARLNAVVLVSVANVFSIPENDKYIFEDLLVLIFPLNLKNISSMKIVNVADVKEIRVTIVGEPTSIVAIRVKG